MTLVHENSLHWASLVQDIQTNPISGLRRIMEKKIPYFWAAVATDKRVIMIPELGTAIIPLGVELRL